MNIKIQCTNYDSILLDGEEYVRLPIGMSSAFSRMNFLIVELVEGDEIYYEDYKKTLVVGRLAIEYAPQIIQSHVYGKYWCEKSVEIFLKKMVSKYVGGSFSFNPSKKVEDIVNYDKFDKPIPKVLWCSDTGMYLFFDQQLFNRFKNS